MNVLGHYIGQGRGCSCTWSDAHTDRNKAHDTTSYDGKTWYLTKISNECSKHGGPNTKKRGR